MKMVNGFPLKNVFCMKFFFKNSTLLGNVSQVIKILRLERVSILPAPHGQKIFNYKIHEIDINCSFNTTLDHIILALTLHL